MVLFLGQKCKEMQGQVQPLPLPQGLLPLPAGLQALLPQQKTGGCLAPSRLKCEVPPGSDCKRTRSQEVLGLLLSLFQLQLLVLKRRGLLCCLHSLLHHLSPEKTRFPLRKIFLLNHHLRKVAPLLLTLRHEHLVPVD